jgi:outer membrane protein assembly factor BamE (lipoprotein component of BamABCDE complex)
MKKYAIAIVTSTALLLSACATTPPVPVTTRNSELTHGNVQLVIKTGSTTQTEIIEAFGAPNITSIDGSGAEVWTYQRSAQVSQSSTQESYWTVILAGQSKSASGFETTSRMITLIIKFDKNKVVSDFRSRSSNF